MKIVNIAPNCGDFFRLIRVLQLKGSDLGLVCSKMVDFLSFELFYYYYIQTEKCKQTVEYFKSKKTRSQKFFEERDRNYMYENIAGQTSVSHGDWGAYLLPVLHHVVDYQVIKIYSKSNAPSIEMFLYSTFVFRFVVLSLDSIGYQNLLKKGTYANSNSSLFWFCISSQLLRIASF